MINDVQLCQELVEFIREKKTNKILFAILFHDYDFLRTMNPEQAVARISELLATWQNTSLSKTI